MWVHLKNLYVLSFFGRFAELNMNGLKLSKPAVDSLCQLAENGCLSTLMLGDTSIGTVS